MQDAKTYTSFSVDDLDQAKRFYTQQLGLRIAIDAAPNMLMIRTGGDTRFMVYHKADHEPASFTVLNFAVDDLVSTVDQLTLSGVSFEPVKGTDAKGIALRGPVKMAWTRDPAGNWLGFSEGM